MTSKIEKSIEKITSKTSVIDENTIPNIALYMDQVTTFIDENLSSTKRYEDDKLLTKTMINNYTKAGLLPPPEKKKYSKDHILMLVLIYYFKSFISISDAKTLLDPLKENYVGSDNGLSLSDFYKDVSTEEVFCHEELINDLEQKLEHVKKNIKATDGKDENIEYKQLFTFISMLSYDIFTKKRIIEDLIDNIDDFLPEK
ncbi:DUF1836 domain-containing protein [uncultured Eubacterium sp.]|uniref:DUF1836 domain-containing protein n=1 Tax=uncultured Eubacterium sp. TaxID=165185 RepID=UPI002592E5AC|nr:DUF1836 domain-containing protein [uncultured Eubacterium sp.]